MDLEAPVRAIPVSLTVGHETISAPLSHAASSSGGAAADASTGGGAAAGGGTAVGGARPVTASVKSSSNSVHDAAAWLSLDVASAQTDVVDQVYCQPTRHTVCRSSTADLELGLPLGLLLTCGVPTEGTPRVVAEVVPKCQRCGAVVSRYCNVSDDGEAWRCAFCSTPNACNLRDIVAEQELKPRAVLSKYPELVEPAFAISSMPSSTPHARGSVDSRLPVVFVVDATADKPYLLAVAEAIQHFVRGAHPDALYGLVVCSSMVRVYELGNVGCSSAEVFSGEEPPSEDVSSEIAAHERQPGRAGGTFLAPGHICVDRIGSIVRGLASDTALSADELPSGHCLEVGVEFGLLLVSLATKALKGVEDRSGAAQCLMRARLVVIAAGGVGAIDTDAVHLAKFKSLGQRAMWERIAVDVLCAGHGAVGIPLWHAFAQSTGGIVCLHADAHALQATLSGILSGHDAGGRSTAAAGEMVTLQLRVAEPLRLVRIIGSVVAVNEVPASSVPWLPSMGPQPTGMQQALPGDKGTLYTFLVPRGVSAARAVSIQLEVTGDVTRPRLPVQATWFWPTTEGQVSCMLANTCFYVVPSTAEVVPTVRWQSCAAMVGKLAVLAAWKAGRMSAGHAVIDEFLRQLAANFGLSKHRRLGSGAEGVPEQFRDMCRLLYHTRCGPLLGAMFQDSDEVKVMQHAFLDACVQDALVLMRPVVQVSKVFLDEAGNVVVSPSEPVPASTLALTSDVCLFMDHLTRMYLWVGRDVQLSDDALHTIAVEWHRGAGWRLPFPELMVTKEGTSMARYVVCRMAPTHHDATSEQVRDHPHLQGYSAEAWGKLRGKFFRSDDLSFNQYCNWLGR